MQGNLIVGQSGGPTAAINASLCGVIEAGIEQGFSGKIYGMRYGIDGLLNEEWIDLGTAFQQSDRRDALLHTPAAYLGSCRRRLPGFEDKPEIYEKLFGILDKHDIRYVLYIGGNDSMDTVYRLSCYAKENHKNVAVLGIPKTIDNDLYGTDHTPGYGSAAKFVATAVREMHRDTTVYDLESVLIVEVMGRNAGWLTAAAALARNEYCTSPDFIYLPEVPFSVDAFLKDVKECVNRQKTVVVAVSEGVRDINGAYLCESVASGAVDTFGHTCLSGAGKVLEHIVRERLGIKARSVELNVLQRCSAHIQSATDLLEARDNGKAAFSAVMRGLTGCMMGYQRENDDSITHVPIDIQAVANKEKTVPRAWINASGNDVTAEFIRYARPLILGESYPTYAQGLPLQIALSK